MGMRQAERLAKAFEGDGDPRDVHRRRVPSTALQGLAGEFGALLRRSDRRLERTGIYPALAQRVP